jgi:hypothetical protein
MTAARTTGERGVLTIELVGFFFAVIFMAAATLQLFVIGSVAVAASNAARTAARVASAGGGGAEGAGLAAIPAGLQDQSSVTVAGGQAVVTVDVPMLLYGGDATLVTLTRTATMPEAAGPAEPAEHAVT